MLRTVRWMSTGKRLSALAVGLALLPGLARAADHRDGPVITDLNNASSGAGALDLNDLFIFRGANRNNTVLIQTMSPGAGVFGPARFFPAAFYDLAISNDGNPLDQDEIVYRTVFQNDGSGQRFSILQSLNGGPFTAIASGPTNGRPVNIRGGGRATAGIFDDPFFFDVNAIANINREVTFIGLNNAGTLRYRSATDPVVDPANPSNPANFPRTTLPSNIDTNGDGTADVNPARFLTDVFPQDFFGGANTLAIVMEFPRNRLQSTRNNPNFTAHMRVTADIGDGRGFAQFDRTALPSLNTVVTPLTRSIQREVFINGFQVEFNRRLPQDDVALRPVAVDRLVTIFGLPAGTTADTGLNTANGLANFFLPDVARFNTTSSSGFPNGRALADDVIDVELGLLTSGGITTDRVNSSSFFRRNFPYIAIPNPVSQTLRAAFEAKVIDNEGLNLDQ